MPAASNLLGQRFGMLTVIGEADRYVSPAGYALRRWNCKCDCGKDTKVSTHALISVNTRSCGCRQRVIMKEQFAKHHLSYTRIYNVWKGMINRCYNPKSASYNRYGGRGITVCDEWRGETGVKNFYEWAIHSGHSDTLTLDRIDNDRGYSPDNCRWATKKQQANNTRWNHLVTINGETHNIGEWAEITGLNRKTIYRRVKLYGLSDDVLLSHSQKEIKEAHQRAQELGSIE